jgi:hypothetical protein
MLKDNRSKEGMSIMQFNIGKLIVIHDDRTDASTLKKHRGPYLQAHHSVLCHIDSLTADVARVFSLSFTSILLGQNTDCDTQNHIMFANLLTMFALFDQCAVLLCNKLGEITNPEDAVFFGSKSNPTVIELANRARPEHSTLLLSAFGYIIKHKETVYTIKNIEEDIWHNMLTTLRRRIVHGQGVFFKSDLDKISNFIIGKGLKKKERDIYLANNGYDHIQAFDFMCFLLFASDKLTSLVRLIQSY